MAFKSYRDASRDNWGVEKGNIGMPQVQTGALLRIADAVEKMAKRHDEMVNARDYWQRRAETVEVELERERRRNAALRGHLSRVKRRVGAGGS